MRHSLAALTLLCVLLSACAGPVSPACTAADDAGTDTGATVDAGSSMDSNESYDAATVIDGCDPLAPVTIGIDSAFAAEAIGASRYCERFEHLRLYVHGTDTIAYDSDSLPVEHIPCPFGDFDMSAPPGDYDLVVFSDTEPQWYSGGDRLHPERCPVGGPGGQFCRPLRILAPPCVARRVMATVYCDPGLGSCPTTTWPWDMR